MCCHSVGVQLLHSRCFTRIAKLSSYTERLQRNAKTRYLKVLNRVDPFLLANSRMKRSDIAPTNPAGFPQVEATDLVSYLVLQTSFVTLRLISL